MKLKFKNQEFQTDAVNAAVELFKGQEKANMTFSIADIRCPYFGADKQAYSAI